MGLLAMHAAPGWSEEIVPFRLTGMEGYGTMRYLSDQYSTADGPGMGHSRQGQSDLREEVFVMTHSYVYHPGLLSLDIGGGPILQRSGYTANGNETIAQGSLYNLSARATVLRDKPYRATFFYDHLNPTQSLAPGQVMTQENERTGATLSLLSPVTPIPLQLDWLQTQSTGRSAERSVSDHSDQWALRASRSFGALGATQAQWQSTQQTSATGSIGLPIQSSRSESESLNVDTRLHFDGETAFDLTQLLNLNVRRYALGAAPVPDQRDFRALLDVRATHSPALRSFASLDFTQNRQGSLETTFQSVSGGMNARPAPDLDVGLVGRHEENRSGSFHSTLQSLDASARYERDAWGGRAQLGYALRIDQARQEAGTAQLDVIGEHLVLSGTAYVPLSRPHVIAGSVVISNASRSQVYLENIDYAVSVVGDQTRIQRLVGGHILDGEDVLADYRYDVGGTYAYRQISQNTSASWTYRDWFNAYLRYADVSPQLISGTPSFPLNVSRSTIIGLRSDLPVGTAWGLTVGGGAEWETRDETISPYRRQTDDLYLQSDTPFLFPGNLRLSRRHTRIDYPNPGQNMNLVGHDLKLWCRPWFGLDVSANVSMERDDGGIQPRQRFDESVSAQWKERKLSVNLQLSHTRESQGSLERSRMLLQLLLRRDF